MNEIPTKTETLIIGFGLTAIPLIRELERSGRDYTIISSGDNIWRKLEQAGRLDFDLVSSYMSTVYSFELARSEGTESWFPTATEFHEFIERYKKEYGSRVIEDWVTSVENREAGSVVQTKSGRIYEANNLVLSTSFRRKIHESILEYDFSKARDRTVVITTMGDSANMFVSKLVPAGSRVILINNGFFCLDKLIVQGGKVFALDELEMHNVGNISGFLYKMVLPQGQIMATSSPGICKPFFGSNLYIKHPVASRDLDRTPALSMGRGSPFTPNLPNGLRITKYWPIDSYQHLFGDDLEESIGKGYLLNDIAYFIDRGLVEMWPRQEVSIDRENRVVRYKDEIVQYDDIIEGDEEVPNLPPITIERPGEPSYRYEYHYRDSFLGVMPRELPNTYFIGFTRPMTGGVNNITEMQCLLTHRMITDDAFRKEVRTNLDERIAAYNREQYVSKLRVASDNLVFSGQYTERIARLMNMQSRLADCRSLEDVSIHYFFPNAPCKYRRSGDYAVEGLPERIRDIHRAHDGYALLKGQLLNYILMMLTITTTLVMLYLSLPIPFAVLLLLLLVAFFTPIVPLINTNSNRILGYTNVTMAIGLALTVLFPHPLVPLGSLLLNFVVVYVCRRLRLSRVLFNDLRFKEKPEFQEFYEKYRAAYRRVYFGDDEADPDAGPDPET